MRFPSSESPSQDFPVSYTTVSKERWLDMGGGFAFHDFSFLVRRKYCLIHIIRQMWATEIATDRMITCVFDNGPLYSNI